MANLSPTLRAGLTMLLGFVLLMGIFAGTAALAMALGGTPLAAGLAGLFALLVLGEMAMMGTLRLTGIHRPPAEDEPEWMQALR